MTPASAVVIMESIMLLAGHPSSARIHTVGTVITVLPLYCPPCQHTFVEILPGAVLRVNGHLWIFRDDSWYSFPELRCPECAGSSLCVGEPL